MHVYLESSLNPVNKVNKGNLDQIYIFIVVFIMVRD